MNIIRNVKRKYEWERRKKNNNNNKIKNEGLIV